MKSSLLVRYGADKILQPVLDETKQLESVRPYIVLILLHMNRLLSLFRTVELHFVLEDQSILFEAQSPFSQQITLQASMLEVIKH